VAAWLGVFGVALHQLAEAAVGDAAQRLLVPLMDGDQVFAGGDLGLDGGEASDERGAAAAAWLLRACLSGLSLRRDELAPG